MRRSIESRFLAFLLLAAVVPGGCTDLGPSEGPHADFEAATRLGTAPLTVRFTDLSSPGSSPITKWTWWFGDGTKSTQQNPTHVYQEPGTYSVALQVETDVDTDSKHRSSFVRVDPRVDPKAEFSGSPRSGGTPLTVQFTDLSVPGSSPITSWSWSFGDGATGTSRNPSHTYDADGTYDVSLTVQTSIGSDTETKSGYIVVTASPTAAFTGTPRSGTSPLIVQFTDQSTPGTSVITDWSWSFGDGETSAEPSPSHTYTAAGSYLVSLTVTTADGSDSEDKAAYIVVSDPVLPTAAFSGSPRTGIKPLEVQFTDRSAPGTSPITAWSWSFGDGGTSTEANPRHTYVTAGSYVVALTVTTSAGSDTDTQPGYVVVSDPVLPTADFSGVPLTGTVPLHVQFTDQSSAGSYAITSWSWSFGDGATSTAPNPSHTYGSPGSYSVSLTVTTSAGSDTATKSGYVVATQPPTADFEGSPRTGDRPLAVQFTDLSTAGSAPITAWSWSFGDGATSTVQSPAHSYDAAGDYTVALTVTTSHGTDTATKAAYVTVSEPPVPPVADFSGAPTSGPAPLAVQFTDLSTAGSAPITSWSWSFGDGTTSAAQSPAHSYQSPGAYSVSLTVTTADGTDAAAKVDYVVVCAPPTADFSASVTSGLAPLTVPFTDLSVPGEGAIAAWSWTFGDGGTSAEQSPSHVYSTPGVYDVTLSVTDGCASVVATKTGFVTVQSPCGTAPVSIADAFVEVRADADQDGCAERARVHFDANTEDGCSRSVFGMVLLRPKGSTEWPYAFQTACFTITGTSATDENWVQVQNLPLDLYEIRIELYECGGATPAASRDYLEDPDLDNQCLE